MPVIKMEIASLTKTQKQDLAKAFTDSATKVTGIPNEAFYVFFDEYAKESIAVGGKLMSDK